MKKGQAQWFRYSKHASLGLEIALAIGIGAVGGRYLETHVTHWSPWTTLLGLFFGLAAAVNGVARTLREYKAELKTSSIQTEPASTQAQAHEPTDENPSILE